MQRHFGRLRAERPFDLLVIGGGINGAGIARDAQLRGLQVALVDKGDWGSGTSSRSSRLIHGGLRYLGQGRLGLVRQSLRERAVLLRTAPHLVRRLRFVAPAWSDGGYGITTLRMGVTLYGLLARGAGLGRHQALSPADAFGAEPSLRRDRLEGAMTFEDARCDDARLVLANVRSAAAAGAVCVNYAKVGSLLIRDGRARGAEVQDLLAGEAVEVAALAVINATGPWSDRTAALAGETVRRLRLTRGAHVVVPRLSRAALLLPTRDGRVLFVLPAGDYSILGTTDTDHQGALDDVAATTADVDFLLEEAARLLPHASSLGPGAVVSCWAALRPLLASDGAPGRLSREHRIEAGPSGVLHVVGGKLTSFRLLAAEVVTRAAAAIGRSVDASVTDVLPLDGGDLPDLEEFVAETGNEISARSGLPVEHAARMAATYGSRVSELAAMLDAEPRLLGRLCPHHPHLALEAAYAAHAEMAMTLSDLLFRRTRVAYGRCRGRDCAEAAAAAMAMAAGWGKARIENEVEAFLGDSKRLTEPRAAGAIAGVDQA